MTVKLPNQVLKCFQVYKFIHKCQSGFPFLVNGSESNTNEATIRTNTYKESNSFSKYYILWHQSIRFNTNTDKFIPEKITSFLKTSYKYTLKSTNTDLYPMAFVILVFIAQWSQKATKIVLSWNCVNPFTRWRILLIKAKLSFLSWRFCTTYLALEVSLTILNIQSWCQIFTPNVSNALHWSEGWYFSNIFKGCMYTETKHSFPTLWIFI